MKTKPDFRNCKTCGIQIEYIPRRVSCLSCYKKLTNYIKPVEEVKFLEDECLYKLLKFLTLPVLAFSFLAFSI